MEWVCRTCTLRNPETVIKCLACDNVRQQRDACLPVDAVAMLSPKSQPSIVRDEPNPSTVRDEPKPSTVRDKPRAQTEACTAETTRPVGISREQQRRVEDEIRAKRRRQEEEKERILREFEADQSVNARTSCTIARSPEPERPIPGRDPVATMAQASTVRLQLKSAWRSLMCSAFGPEATLREVLAFANDEMQINGRIMRSELHPDADPEFVRRTQEMLRQSAPALSEFVSFRLPYPPRTQWKDDDLDVTLAGAGLTPSCTLLLEDKSHGPIEGMAPEDRIEIESEPTNEAVASTSDLSANRLHMLEAAERRQAQLPRDFTLSEHVSFYPHVNVGPGSKTRRQQEEEKRRILQRAEEERLEIAARRVRIEQAAPTPIAEPRVPMVQIKHPGGTVPIAITEEMTFAMLLSELRPILQLEGSAYTFRTNYPRRRFSMDELSLRVSDCISPPAVIILEIPGSVAQVDAGNAPEEIETPEAVEAREAVQPQVGRPVQNPARAAALAAAESRMQNVQIPPVQDIAPALPPTSPPRHKKKIHSSLAPREAGMTAEQRLAREQQMKMEREARQREKELILKQSEADQAFRAAKRMVPVGLDSPHPSASSSTRAQWDNGNRAAEELSRMDSAVHTVSPSRDGYTASRQHEPFLRIRDPDGVTHYAPYISPDMTLLEALVSLNLALLADSFVAQIPCARRSLAASEWTVPLRTFPDIFPHGTVVIIDATLRGDQRSGGPVLDPFSAQAISEAFPPALMDGTELAMRMSKLSDGLATEELVTAEEQCRICICPFQLNDRLGTLPCAHRFHWDCIARSLRYSTACPFCRQH